MLHRVGSAHVFLPHPHIVCPAYECTCGDTNTFNQCSQYVLMVLQYLFENDLITSEGYYKQAELMLDGRKAERLFSNQVNAHIVDFFL